MSKAPKDKKNLERQVKLRYAINSGQSSIHGETLYEIETQEAQSFAFHSGTGQGGTGGGPGTGKAVLYTPGQSCEVLGEGLKVRKPGDTSQLPAKIIECKRGDSLGCKDGNILLKQGIFLLMRMVRSRWTICCKPERIAHHAPIFVFKVIRS